MPSGCVYWGDQCIPGHLNCCLVPANRATLALPAHGPVIKEDLRSSLFWYWERWSASKTILCDVFQQGLPLCWRRRHIFLPFLAQGSWSLACPGEDTPVVRAVLGLTVPLAGGSAQPSQFPNSPGMAWSLLPLCCPQPTCPCPCPHPASPICPHAGQALALPGCPWVHFQEPG